MKDPEHGEYFRIRVFFKVINLQLFSLQFLASGYRMTTFERLLEYVEFKFVFRFR